MPQDCHLVLAPRDGVLKVPSYNNQLTNFPFFLSKEIVFRQRQVVLLDCNTVHSLRHTIPCSSSPKGGY